MAQVRKLRVRIFIFGAGIGRGGSRTVEGYGIMWICGRMFARSFGRGGDGVGKNYGLWRGRWVAVRGGIGRIMNF